MQSVEGQPVASMGEDDVFNQLVEKAQEIHSRHPDAVGFIGIAKSPSCGIAVGVRKLGTTIKAPMHSTTSIPTVEINQLKTWRDRSLFLDRIVKYFSYRALSKE